MPIAQGINKRTAIVKQSGLGSLGTTGSKYRRRVTSTFSAPADTFVTNEIVSHQQSTGANYGTNRPAGQLQGELSPATYQEEFAALLRRAWTQVTSLTGLTVSIAASGSLYTVTRSTGDFMSGGLKVGMVIRLSGGTLNADTINKNLLIVSLTATVATVAVLNGSTMTAPQNAITSVTVAVPGRVTYAPETGHTNDYFTIEEQYADIARYERYGDMQVAQAALSLPATGNATASFDWVGRTRALSGSQSLTTPSAETTTSVLTAVNGAVVINGARVINITGAEITINGNIANLDPVVGSNTVPDNQRGRIAVSGSFSAYFEDATIQTIFDNRTTTSLLLAITDSSLAAADFVAIALTKLKITSDQPNDGEQAIVRSYSFTAEIDGSGGASAATLKTICLMQDSQAT